MRASQLWGYSAMGLLVLSAASVFGWGGWNTPELIGAMRLVLVQGVIVATAWAIHGFGTERHVK